MVNKKEQLEGFVQKIDDKDFNMYFFVIDTKGNPSAGVANIYEHVKLLNELGYKAHILHEAKDYTKVGEWLGEEYDELSHICIKSAELKINPVDFLFVPEIFYTLMEQCKHFPCKKIVFAQNYNYALEGLPIGKKWNESYGFRDVVTTTEKQAELYQSLFRGIKTHIVPVSIPSYMKDTEELDEPVILLSSRDQGAGLRMVKKFYLKYPQYQWVSFKEVRNIAKKELNKELSKACLTVWMDETASFGTLPLESMACGTPVIGVIPKMVPEWMEHKVEKDTDVSGLKDDGIWVFDDFNIPDFIAQYMDSWLEDNFVDFLAKDKIKEVPAQYSEEKQKEVLNKVYSEMVKNRSEEFKQFALQYEQE